MSLDEHVARLQNLEPFNIHSVGKDGVAKPWYDVTGAIVKDLVIREVDLALQIQAVSAQISHWGRHAAQCKRVWEIEERLYRSWRSKFYLEAIKAAEKKPSDKQIEARYRVDPEYVKYQVAIERAEEAYSSTMSILDGFRAKRDMLRSAVRRSAEDGAPQLSV